MTLPEDEPANSHSSQAKAPVFMIALDHVPTLAQLEGLYLEHLLKYFGGNKSKLADAAEVDRRTVYRMLKRHGIDPKIFKQKRAPTLEQYEERSARLQGEVDDHVPSAPEYADRLLKTPFFDNLEGALDE